MVRVLVVLVAALLMCGCEEDIGQDEWLRIENGTTEQVFVMERGVTDPALLVLGLDPDETGRAPLDRCDTTVLEAHVDSASGPVVATRDAGARCADTWVIESGR